MTTQGSPNATAPATASATSQPAASSQVVVERPPPGLAQGQYAWPAWGIMLLGGLGVAVSLIYLLLRHARRRPSRTQADE